MDTAFIQRNGVCWGTVKDTPSRWDLNCQVKADLTLGYAQTPLAKELC
jgi:hypothetical protein